MAHSGKYYTEVELNVLICLKNILCIEKRMIVIELITYIYTIHDIISY